MSNYPPPVKGFDNGTWTPQRDIWVWDARTGKLIAHRERLLPDPELIRQGWKHLFPAMMYVGESAERDTTRVVTQLVREVREKYGVESRAVIHDLKTGRQLLTLDPCPGVPDRAQFTFDDKHLVTTHRVRGPTGKNTFLFTVWDAATGQRVNQYPTDDGWRGFTLDGAAFGSAPDPSGKGMRVKEALTLPNGGRVTPAPRRRRVDLPPAGRWGVPRAGTRLEVRDAHTGPLLDTLPGAGAPAVRAPASGSVPAASWPWCGMTGGG